MLKQRGIGSDTALASDLKTEDVKRIKWAQGLAYPKDLAEYEAVDGCDCPIHSRAQGSYQHVVPFWSIEFQNPSHWGRFNLFVLVLREREGYISYPNTFIPFGAHRVKSSRLTHYEWIPETCEMWWLVPGNGWDCGLVGVGLFTEQWVDTAHNRMLASAQAGRSVLYLWKQLCELCLHIKNFGKLRV